MNNRESFWMPQKSNQEINKQIEEDIFEGDIEYGIGDNTQQNKMETNKYSFRFEPTRNIENEDFIDEIYYW